MHQSAISRLRLFAYDLDVSTDSSIIERLNALLEYISDVALRDTELSKKLHFSVK